LYNYSCNNGQPELQNCTIIVVTSNNQSCKIVQL